MSLEALVAQVKEIQRADPTAKEQWAMYTTAHGAGTRDPSRHTPEFLQGFLDNHASGGMGMGMAAAGGMTLGGFESGDVAMLVSKVKELQRQSPGAKEQWAAFTDLNGGGTRDPSKHTADFLQGFVDHIGSGHQIMPQAGAGMSENPLLVEAFKLLQKKSDGFKTAWKQYAATAGGGRFDPSKHPADFHLAFLDHIASLASGGGGGSMAQMGAPQKMMRDSSGMGMGMGGTGDPTKDALINRIKAYQRLGTEQKELWCLYSDTYLGGVRDPARHDANTLNEFCVNHEVPEASISIASLGGGMGMSMGMGAMGMGASPGGVMGMGADPEKDALVQRVKAFQRLSPDNKETWGSFCGPTKDPSRHTSEKLQEFISLFSVP